MKTAVSIRPPPLWLGVVLALGLAALLTWPKAATVWATGAFLDSDDAMRAVELRDFLAGQSWFDLAIARVDPPQGMISHWSRFIDAPLAGLDTLLRAVLPPDQAERATRLLFPFALLAALFALAGWNASIIGGVEARLPAVWMTLLSGPMFIQFAPGRIDHHAPQIVLLLTAFGLFLQGLARPAALAAAAATVALSLAISLENMPFFAVLAVAAAFLFVFDGEKSRPQLFAFAGGALVAFPLCFAATVSPARFFAPACDALSIVYAAPAMAGALALMTLAAVAPHLPSRRGRALACLAAAGAVAALVAPIAAPCRGGPFSGLDPLLADLWLSHVREIRPLLSFWAEAPQTVLMTAVPVSLALCAALILAGAARSSLERRRALLLAGAIAVGLAAGFLHVRVFSSVTPLAMPPLAVALRALARRVAEIPLLRASITATLGLVISPLGLALLLPAAEDSAAADDACLRPDILAPLASLPPTRVAAPFELGAHLLAHTPHSVFAAPYHRNNHGNRLVADAFLSPPAQAEAILRTAGAGLLLWCEKNSASPTRYDQRSNPPRLRRGPPSEGEGKSRPSPLKREAGSRYAQNLNFTPP